VVEALDERAALDTVVEMTELVVLEEAGAVVVLLGATGEVEAGRRSRDGRSRREQAGTSGSCRRGEGKMLRGPSPRGCTISLAVNQ
jgi:hypothetical protein